MLTQDEASKHEAPIRTIESTGLDRGPLYAAAGRNHQRLGYLDQSHCHDHRPMSWPRHRAGPVLTHPELATETLQAALERPRSLGGVRQFVAHMLRIRR